MRRNANSIQHPHRCSWPLDAEWKTNLMREPVLIFDFGNVIAFFDYLLAWEKFGRRIGAAGFRLESSPRTARLRGSARLDSRVGADDSRGHSP